MNRREFVGSLAAGAAVFSALPAARVLGANDRIRIGLIGAGDRGQQDLKDSLRQPNVECVAVADLYSRRRDQVKAKIPGVAVYDDHRRLLERKDIDAVIIASSLNQHASCMLAALEAGKDVYCEKTITYDIPEAVACKKAAEDSKQIVQIGQQHESDGDLADAKKWIHDGLLGKVAIVESWMSRNTRHGHGQWVRAIPKDCDPQHVNWNVFMEGRPKAEFDANRFINWRLFWEFSGGNITENMVHQIGWVMTALDLKEPLAATMSGGIFVEKDGRQVPDTIAVTLEYPEMVVLWQSSFSNSHFGLGERILGSDGTIEHVSGSTDMVTGKYTSGITYYPEKLNRPTGEVLVGQSVGSDHMENWMECIRSRNKQRLHAPVEIGYRSAVVAHMSNLAYRLKRRITLEEAMVAKPMY
jgi:predicted dehydrogenase